MHKMSYLLGIFITLFSINGFTATTPINLIIGSTLSIGENTERPFVLKGNESMSEWQFSNNFTGLSSNIKWFIVESIACVDKNCLSVGGYNTFLSPDTVKALVLRSEDKGSSWALKDVTPLNSGKADLKNINCDEDQCTAIGFYYTHLGNKQPLILTSVNKFQSWQQVRDIAGFDPNASLESFRSTCTKEFCVIGASLPDAQHYPEKPIFLYSNKNKMTWSLAKLSPEVKHNGINIENISCSNDTCVAVGYSFENSHFTFPSLYISYDKGATWVNKKLEDELGQGQLSAVKCKDNTCIAVGRSNIPGRENEGLLLVSQDKGNTWQIKHLPAPKSGILYLNEVNCTDRFCMIGSDSSQANQLFIYVSQDKGETWSRKNIINLPEVSISHTTGLSCNNESCLYTLEDGVVSAATRNPIVIISDNSGEQWQVQPKILNIPDTIYRMLVDGIFHA